MNNILYMNIIPNQLNFYGKMMLDKYYKATENFQII